MRTGRALSLSHRPSSTLKHAHVASPLRRIPIRSRECDRLCYRPRPSAPRAEACCGMTVHVECTGTLAPGAGSDGGPALRGTRARSRYKAGKAVRRDVRAIVRIPDRTVNRSTASSPKSVALYAYVRNQLCTRAHSIRAGRPSDDRHCRCPVRAPLVATPAARPSSRSNPA